MRSMYLVLLYCIRSTTSMIYAYYALCIVDWMTPVACPWSLVIFESLSFRVLVYSSSSYTVQEAYNRQCAQIHNLYVGRYYST